MTPDEVVKTRNDDFYYTHDLTQEAIDFSVHSFSLFKNEREAIYWKFDNRGNIEWLLSSPSSTVGRWVLYHYGEKAVAFKEELLEYLLSRFGWNKSPEEKIKTQEVK